MPPKFVNREVDCFLSNDIILYDRASGGMITWPYPMQENGQPIQPSGMSGWCERRGLEWECDCASRESRACPVTFIGYLKSVAMCAQNPIGCALHLDFKMIVLTTKTFSNYKHMRTLASIENDLNRVVIRPRIWGSRDGQGGRGGAVRISRRFTGSQRQLQVSPYMRPLEHARARARASQGSLETTPLPSNQLALCSAKSLPSSQSSSGSSGSSSSSTNTELMDAGSSTLDNSTKILERLDAGWGIDDQEYLELVDKCEECGKNFLAKHIATHRRVCSDNSEDIWAGLLDTVN